MLKDKRKKLIFDYIVCVVCALIMAVNYEVLIFPNSFAPAGLNGLTTIIQHVFDFSVGYMSIIINIPLLVASYFLLDKEFTFKTAAYVFAFSIFILIIKNGDTDLEGFIDVSNFIYKTPITSKIIAPVFSGAIGGILFGYLLHRNSCSGGTDIVAKLIRIKHPELNMMWLMFALNSVVAVLSYFAYAENGVYNIEPVLLCFIYSFTCSKMGDVFLKGTKTALKFEVVTSYPEEISKEIIQKLQHTTTAVHAEGMYSHLDKSLLICVINKNQIVEFERIVTRYPDTFAYISSVNETFGKFVKGKKSKDIIEGKKGKCVVEDVNGKDIVEDEKCR